jgi:hypothetical protein
VESWCVTKPVSVWRSVGRSSRSDSSPHNQWLSAFIGATALPVSRLPVMSSTAAENRPASVPATRPSRNVCFQSVMPGSFCFAA